MGHFGVAKTLDVLHEHLYWPKMKRDVQLICGQCIACSRSTLGWFNGSLWGCENLGCIA
jgi:hypothetical protein